MPYTITIINMRTGRYPRASYDVRVDRSHVLGNPFQMQHESQRDKVCDAYKEWFNKKLDTADKPVVDALHELNDIGEKHGKLNLFCWCAPKRCHAETIKEYLEGGD